MEILEIKNLTFYYPESETPVIKDFSVSVEAGDFFVIFGQSGCGKTTLLRQLKPQISPYGKKNGDILFEGISIGTLDTRESASKIGFVSQSPDNQIVTDKVWHELAFGMESLGYDTLTIRRRVAEMASFFGIQDWFYKNVSELSGGQKQLLNLASVMVMQPEILILDEPTGQLDPIAASDFLAILKKINRELGTTVILTEHRLEEALSIATRAAVMEKGQILCCGTVTEVGVYLKQNNHDMFSAMPTAMQIWGSVESDLFCPVSVNEGRTFLKIYSEKHNINKVKNDKPIFNFGVTRVSVHDVWFRYEKDLPDVARGVNLTARAGELLCIFGGNGTGKTTMLKLLSGYCKPYRGEIKTDGKICLLPQNPQTLFVKKTVWEDLSDVLKDIKLSKNQKEEKIEHILKICRLLGLENRNPYDLSGGEQQRAALSKLLLLNPDILLLDEPTKGLDARFKTEFAVILKELLSIGVCVIMVSHDVEFCAEYADRCALFFDGNIACEDTPRKFFSGNSFYTTSANRIARNIIPDAVLTDDVIEAIGGKTKDGIPEQFLDYTFETDNKEEIIDKITESLIEKPKKIPLWRKIGAFVSALFSLGILLYEAKFEKLNEIVDRNGSTVLGRNQLCIYGVFILFLILTAIFIGRRSASSSICQLPKEKRKLSKRTTVSVIFVLLLIPLTLFIGVVYIDHKQYYLTALAILLECMFPFFMIFEGRKPKARELVIIAVLCALGIAGRAAFFMLPQFKPVLALTVISGVAFGGETGFLVGAVTMLVSNIMFSQGPWTPWQMFAMGIIGFIAGILYQKGWICRTRLSLCIFGSVCAILIYGGIMNPVSALIWGSESLNWNIIIGYYVTGFPMDCVHSAATAIFLWFISEPMLEKLDRIKMKYGLSE